MDEDKIEERFNQLEKRVSDGFVHIENLIEALANICSRQFESIDERLESIEDKIEGFSHRMDNEVEARHQLAERVTKIEG